ncbi:hypothetical protein FB561_3403 [Kribbella amoyensis]|uniref:Uncharacterized protein n=1 Tax=Kribbella amoyensis TaxID=996641 RepID=A0A561BTQ8_9ACTN|nr:hypothetical protein [Kribbella amoyensis]TWD82274.1 hypothetical protein FB561_3403 [Kribbella amoyensis]
MSEVPARCSHPATHRKAVDIKEGQVVDYEALAEILAKTTVTR